MQERTITINFSINATEQKFSFDPRGRRHNPTDWTLTGVPTNYILDRGFNGHEHLDVFDLVNMNGRMYDPVLGRMLSPDNYVQAPNSSQSFNRYSYCFNNPLVYTDPDGELLAGLLRGLLDALSSGGLEFWNWGDDYWEDAWAQADPFNPGTAGNNSYRIWEGYFTGPDFFGQLPQNTFGMASAHTANIFGNVRSVERYDGSTVVQGNNDGLLWGLGGPAFTSGNFIIGDKTIEANPNNTLFQHEFGHVLQSRDMKWGYFPRVAIPSLESRLKYYSFNPVEQDANRRAFIYFNKKDPNFQNDKDYGFDENSVNKGWNFIYNPLDVDRSGDGTYVQYDDPESRKALNGMWDINATFWDNVAWFIPPVVIIQGHLNANKYRGYP